MAEKYEGMEIYDPTNPKHAHHVLINKVLERDDSTKRPIKEIKVVGEWTFSAVRKAKLLETKPEFLTKRAFEISAKVLRDPDNVELLNELKRECREKK